MLLNVVVPDEGMMIAPVPSAVVLPAAMIGAVPVRSRPPVQLLLLPLKITVDELPLRVTNPLLVMLPFKVSVPPPSAMELPEVNARFGLMVLEPVELIWPRDKVPVPPMFQLPDEKLSVPNVSLRVTVGCARLAE